MGSLVAIGTLKGKVYLVNRFSGLIEKTFQPHEKKISGIYIREGASIATCSNDGTIHIESLKGEQPKRINFKDQYEISCFCHIDPNSDGEFVLGFGKGDIWHYKEKSFLFNKNTIRNSLYKGNQEGSIISVVYYKKILAWATAKMIRLRYYPNFEEGGKNICYIELPTDKSDRFPEHLYHKSTISKPNIVFMKSKQTIHDPHPNNITMVASWYNMIKVTELLYD